MSPGEHGRKNAADEQDRRQGVDLQGLFDALLGQLADRLKIQDADRIDQNVDMAKPARGLLEQGLPFTAPGDIGRYRMRLARQLVCQLQQCLLAQSRERQASAL